jgi:hypothetical protein
MIKIAFIKESSYQDLWIGSNRESIQDLVLNTHMRIGPVALIDTFQSDFYIVPPNLDFSAIKLRRAQLPHISEEEYERIRNRADSCFFSSCTTRVPRDYETQIHTIDFSSYSIVICINQAIPDHIRSFFPHVVWICLPGEGVIPYPNNDWNFWITHNCPTFFSLFRWKRIDMPYTFIYPDFLRYFNKISNSKRGIYIEINSVSKENRSKASHIIDNIIPLSTLGLPISFHPDSTSSHINLLHVSKYYVKTGGRPIRGNGLIEAMAANLICLIKPDHCFGALRLPSFCYYRNYDELAQKIAVLESDPQLYALILKKQRAILYRITTLTRFQLYKAILLHSFLQKLQSFFPLRSDHHS